MTADRPSPSTAAAWTLGALASGLAGGYLNFAVSALDAPRAYGAPLAALLPLAASVALVLALAALASLVLAPLARALGLGPLPASAGLFGLVVCASGTAPLVEILGRGVAAERLPALVALALGVALLGMASAFLAVERFEALRTKGWQAGCAIFAVVGTWSLWYGTYRGGRLAALALVGLAGVSIAVACVRWRLPQRSLLVGLLLATFAGGLIGGFTGGARALSASSPALDGSGPPAIVLVTVDTLRPDILADEATPALDGLLADSIVFEQARSAAPWTKPALATILTGLSPWVHRTTSRRKRLPDELTTLAEHLRAAGYRTGGAGLNVHLERMFNFAQGFDDYAFPARAELGISFGAKLLTACDPDRFPELFPSTTAVADVAIDWLERAVDGERPVFLWMHVLDPHWPYEPPADYTTPPESGTRIANYWGDPDTVTNVQAGNLKLGEADRARVRELYRGEIRYVDDNVGRLLAKLRELGLYDESLIVFASDHGEEFWEHGSYEHGHTLYDEVLRVPLAFKLPASNPSRAGRRPEPVSTESLTPTVLDLLGRSAKTTGRSLRPLWESPGSVPAEPLFSNGTYYRGEKEAVVFDGLKLVVDLETKRVELYDLAADPAELDSLASSRPRDVARGRELLEARFRAAQDLRAELGLGDDEADLDPLVHARLKALGYAGSD